MQVFHLNHIYDRIKYAPITRLCKNKPFDVCFVAIMMVMVLRKEIILRSTTLKTFPPTSFSSDVATRQSNETRLHIFMILGVGGQRDHFHNVFFSTPYDQPHWENAECKWLDDRRQPKHALFRRHCRPEQSGIRCARRWKMPIGN